MTTNSRRRAFARNVDFSFIVSGSERTFTFRVSLNTLPTLATLVREDRRQPLSYMLYQMQIFNIHLRMRNPETPRLTHWNVCIKLRSTIYIASKNGSNTAQKHSIMSIVKQFNGNKILSSAEFVSLFRKYDNDGEYMYYIYDIYIYIYIYIFLPNAYATSITISHITFPITVFWS